jgi:glycosyltransferase involved in cell wall biosynthesis
LGEILCSRGLLTPEQIIEVLRRQAQWVARTMQAEMQPQGFPYRARLSLCLPAYNEQANIESTLDAACVILPEFVADYEIVVVDDGSKDETARVVAEYSRRNARVRLVQHERNRGYGGAVTSGLRAATGDLVIFTDSDGQFSLLDLPQVLAQLGDRDLVVGYRFQRADKRIRLLNAWAWNRLVRLVLGVRVRDLDCAFKLFRRELVERLQLTASGACINAEILAQCVRSGLAFREVPVTHYPRYQGAATGANLKVIAKAFRELPRLWKYRHAAPLAATPEPAARRPKAA